MTTIPPRPLKLPYPLQQLFTSDAFSANARTVAEIPEPTFKAALAAINSASGFLGPRRILRTLGEIVNDEAHAQALTTFVINFASLARGLEESYEELSAEVAAALPDLIAQGKLTSEQGGTLERRLPHIARPVPAIEQNTKAEQLARRTGAHLHDIAIVCDMRPVFDEPRETINGVVPMATLRLVTHDHGSTTVLEVILSEDDLTTMCELAERAKKKLRAIRQFVQASNVDLPEIGTLAEDE